MEGMRRSRCLARLAATVTVGMAGVAGVASPPAQAGIVIQAHVMAAWGHGLLGDAWGHGLLGDGGGPGRSLYSLVPVQAPRLDHVTQISAGYGFSLALRSDGTVWAWGYDTSGQLGNAPSTSPVTRPVNTIGVGSGITQLSAGGAHVLALKSNGTVLAWGNNQLSQLGIGSQASVTGPVQVTGLASATQVAAGLDVSFAIHAVPYLVGL
jgi:alpha-tubulin suppressor-like RCC1 family protein